MITVSAAALALAGLGTFINNTNKVSASQPVRVFRETNGRDNHGYYGFYYKKDMNNPKYENYGPPERYQYGLLPKYLRGRGKFAMIYDPYIKEERPIKKHRSRYYIDDIDGQHYSHGKYYNEFLINTKDVHGITNRQDKSKLRAIKSQMKRNKRIIRRHRHNHKLVDRLEDRNTTLQIQLNTDNTNDRMKMDSRRGHRANRKYRHKRIRRTLKRRKRIRRSRGHYRKHINKKRKVIRHQHKPGNKGSNQSKNVQKPSSQNKNVSRSNYAEDIQQMEDQTLRDINNDRAQNGVAPLKENKGMMQLAKMRANQSVQLGHLRHKNANGQNYYKIDASQLDVNLGNRCGENLAGAGLGNMTMDGSPEEYHNNNGNDMADMDENEMVNHDQNSDWGHRANILDPKFTEIGIGAGYKASNDTFYLAEDFAGEFSSDSNNSTDSSDTNNRDDNSVNSSSNDISSNSESTKHPGNFVKTASGKTLYNPYNTFVSQPGDEQGNHITAQGYKHMYENGIKSINWQVQNGIIPKWEGQNIENNSKKYTESKLGYQIN